MMSGMSFLSFGAETEKAQSPKYLSFERGITNKFLLDHREIVVGLQAFNKSLI